MGGVPGVDHMMTVNDTAELSRRDEKMKLIGKLDTDRPLISGMDTNRGL